LSGKGLLKQFLYMECCLEIIFSPQQALIGGCKKKKYVLFKSYFIGACFFNILKNRQSTVISELYVSNSPSRALWKSIKQAVIQSFAKHCHKFFIWQLTFSLVFLAAIGTFSKKGAGEKYLV